jgi:hypothetical protein
MAPRKEKSERTNAEEGLHATMSANTQKSYLVLIGNNMVLTYLSTLHLCSLISHPHSYRASEVSGVKTLYNWFTQWHCF